MRVSSCTDFYHPYEPYDIQLELMRCIYDLLNEGKKLAILESPTGTGKTLSLICSVVTWLRDNKADLIVGLNQVGPEKNSSDDDDSDDDADEPDWVNDAYKSSALESKLQDISDYEHYLDKMESKTKNSNSIEQYQTRKKRKNLKHINVSIDDNDFVPENYTSDSEDIDIKSNRASQLRDEVSDLLAKLDSKKNGRLQGSPVDFHNPVKIFFASRTHSQLNQFASQLGLPNFPSSFQKYNVPKERLKYLPLASRRQLCVNPSVNKLKSAEAINDACAELLRSKKGCSFYKSPSNDTNSRLYKSFQDETFVTIHDIEDLAQIGETLQICPFYASRSALSNAEIVTLPYQYLLSESTRESLSIDVSNSIVIIDEAHNLLDTINSIHSAEVSLTDLLSCNKGLNIYYNKFKTRLNPGNRVNLMKLIRLLNVLTDFIQTNYKKGGQKIDPNSIFANTNADTLNIHRINKYIKKSKIAFKIDSFIQAYFTGKKSDGTNGIFSELPSSQPLLFKVLSFISCLSNPAGEGQFFFEKGNSIKYMLLEPGKPFQSILDKSRCVILAGGTMQPVSEILDNISSSIPENEITVFSCDHVIPNKNLETFIISDSQFEFTFEKREQPTLISDLFHFYDKLSQAVPFSGGIVGFFPSYQYLEDVINKWKKAGLFRKLENRREVFYESRGGQDPLPNYSGCIAKGKGAILFAVVGGKLSEGINFQDDLCRAVVMVGLPFPNVFSGELLVKKRHLENKITSNGGSKGDASKAVKSFYETICMKAVNQSIGRAIRHANDFALIYLLDRRYQNRNIKEKLSHWVERRIQPEGKVDNIMIATRKFFSGHNTS